MQSQNTSASGAFSLAVGLENAGAGEVEGYNFTLIQRGLLDLTSSFHLGLAPDFYFKIDNEIIDNNIFDTSGTDTKQFAGSNLYISTQTFTSTLIATTSIDSVEDAQVYAGARYSGTTFNLNEIEVAWYNSGVFSIEDESKVTQIDNYTICIPITEGCTIELIHNHTG